MQATSALDVVLHRRAPDNPNAPAYIRLDKAELLALWLETLFYGCYTVLFFVTLYALVYKRSTERVNRPMFVTAIVIFILATMHLAIDLSRGIDAFIYPEGLTAPQYFAQLAHPKHLFKTGVYATETVVADALVVYRVYVVWGRNLYVILLPTLLVFANAVAGIGVAIQLSRLAGPHDNVFAEELADWVTSFFSITLSTNTLCTLLIAGRIWWTSRGTKALTSYSPQMDLMSVIQIVVESGAIYSITLVIQIIVYLLHSNAQYTVLDPISPIIGIVFSLIIIRVGLGLTHGGSGKGNNGKRSGTNFTTGTTSMPFPMKPLSVTVTQGVHVDRGQTDTCIADVSRDKSSPLDRKRAGSFMSDQESLAFTPAN